MSQTYSDVDASGDPVEAADWQKRMSAWPGVRAYKERSYEMLGAADRVIDVGCGPGVDIAPLGRTRCIGAELSATMAGQAARRGAIVCRADATRLPFADGVFTGARADRVLQHVTDPERALREMARVTAPGGRVVVADPDQETLMIQVPGVRRSVLDRVKALRRDLGYRNGTCISRVPRLLTVMGFDHVETEAFPLLIRDPSEAFGLATWPAIWRAEGRFTEEELQEWDAALRQPQKGGFLYVVTILVVAGTRR